MKFWALAIILVGALSGCTWNTSRVANQTVVQVNDHKLSTKELARELARRLRKLDALSAKDSNNVRRAKEEIIRNFILASMIDDYAKNEKLSVTEEDLEKSINQIRSSYPDDLSFRRVLAEENLSFSAWKDELKKSLLERRVFAKLSEKAAAPTEAEIRSYYDEHKDRFRRKERAYIRQIIVDEITKAQSLREELKKKDFADTAKKFSVAPEGKTGGIVGWIERGSVDIFDKAFTLPVGGLSQVLESSYGFHIFKVERKAPAGIAALEEVRDVIIQAIKGQKEQGEFAAWLDKQIRASRVLRDNDLISAISVETRGE